MLVVPTLEEIRASILRDVQSFDMQADVGVDSDHYARASALAVMAEGLYAQQKWMIQQFFPDTADTLYLEKHASLRGIVRRSATFAEGRAVISGSDGASLASGAQLKTDDGRIYQTTADVAIDSSGRAEVAIKAVQVGRAQNITHSVEAQILSPARGVLAKAQIVQAEGGTDAESDASLLARLLALIRRPPAGGNIYDYRNWALSVDGVESAYVYPLRRGLGTVDIAITTKDGTPAPEVIKNCQEYIDSVRPVTAIESKVVAPDEHTLDCTIEIQIADGAVFDTVKAQVEEAVKDYFKSINPGDHFIHSQLEAMVSNVNDVVDRAVLAPSGNQLCDTVSKIEWFRLGSLNISAMRVDGAP